MFDYGNWKCPDCGEVYDATRENCCPRCAKPSPCDSPEVRVEAEDNGHAD